MTTTIARVMNSVMAHPFVRMVAAPEGVRQASSRSTGVQNESLSLLGNTRSFSLPRLRSVNLSVEVVAARADGEKVDRELALMIPLSQIP